MLNHKAIYANTRVPIEIQTMHLFLMQQNLFGKQAEAKDLQWQENMKMNQYI